jgi:hypothetical protein
MVATTWQHLEHIDLDKLGRELEAPKSFKAVNPVVEANKDGFFGQAVASLLSAVHRMRRQGIKPRANFKPKPKRKRAKRPPTPR